MAGARITLHIDVRDGAICRRWAPAAIVPPPSTAPFTKLGGAVVAAVACSPASPALHRILLPPCLSPTSSLSSFTAMSTLPSFGDEREAVAALSLAES